MSALRKTLGEYLFVALTLIIGLGVSIWMALAEHRAATLKAQEQFRIAAGDRISVITQSMRNNIAVSHSVVSLFQSSESVSREEFANFTAQIIKDYPYIEALEWAPHVREADRFAYEATAGLLIPDYGFRDIREDGTLVPAASRPSYYPIYYIEPVKEGTARVFGVDFMSNPIRRKALETAMQTGKTAASAKVTLLSSGQPGVLFFSPVIKREILEGFIISVIPLNTIIVKAIEPLNKEGVNIIAHDVTEPGSDAAPLFVYSSRLKAATEEEIVASFRAPGMREQATIDVAGRKWRITIMPSKGYFVSNNVQGIAMIFIIGCAFTCMLAFYMIARIRENQRISRLVELRTKEVELILHSTSEGIIGLDQRGNIAYTNETACELLGYDQAELLGRDYHLLLQHSKATGEAQALSDATVSKVLQTGIEARNIDNEIFWRNHNMPLQVEYTVSAMVDDEEVIGAVIIFRDITQRKINEQKLERMALYDQLTNLANRRLFLELLHKALGRASRTGTKVGVVYLDLNNFKPVNDALGHNVGDMLLEAFGARVSEVLRDHDTMARLGGDEFAILMDQVRGPADCRALIARILTALEEPFTLMGEQLQVSSSIGVALYPDDADTLDGLIHAADSAMYAAKKDKSRKFMFFTKAAA